MNRRTHDLLAQRLQELDEGVTRLPASDQPDALREPIETWDRLSAVRPVEAGHSDMSAGRERMFSALYAKNSRRRTAWISVMSPLLRFTAVAAGILVLTGAAAGASVAVGGPPIWRTAGISRGADRAEEHANAGDGDMKLAAKQASPESGSGDSEVAAEKSSPADADSPASDGTSDATEDVSPDGDSKSDAEDMAAEPSGEAELSDTAASSTPDPEGHDGDGEIGEEAATPR